MIQTNTQLPPRRKVDALDPSLDALQAALAADVPGREREWAQAVGDTLTRVEAALRQRRWAAEAPDGLLAEVDETRPTLARQADELRSELDEFMKRIAPLRDETARAVEAFQPLTTTSARPASSGIVDFGAIRQQGEQLLAGLRENEDEEAKLILESINTDIGAGD
jgi:hypothetical protein